MDSIPFMTSSEEVKMEFFFIFQASRWDYGGFYSVRNVSDLSRLRPKGSLRVGEWKKKKKEIAIIPPFSTSDLDN